MARTRGLFISILALWIGRFGFAEEVPTFHGDNARTGRTEWIGPTAPTLKWKFTAAASFEASPVIGKDGTVYAASTDHNLYALKPDGTVKWVFAAEESIFSTPAIGPDGVIYIADLSGKYYAIAPDGKPKWNAQLSGGTELRIISPLLVAPDGQIYFGAWNSQFYAVNPDKSVRWQAKLGGLISSSPVSDAEGNLYVAAFDTKRSSNLAIYKFRPSSSSPTWTFTDSIGVNYNRVISTPAVDGERGRLYFGAARGSDGVLYGVNLADGRSAFRVDLPKGVISSPAIAKSGVIYVGCLDGKLYALDPAAGAQKWAFATSGYCVTGSPSVDGNGVIYIGDSDGMLYAVSPEGKELWRFAAGSNIASAPAIAEDGTLYFTSYDSTIYAIGKPTAINHWSEY